MNLADTVALYSVATGGEPVRSTLPEDGTNHPETPFSKEQQRKREEVVGGVVTADSAGGGIGTTPDIYNVVDPMGRILHKDMSYEQAKRAAESRRYAKVVHARPGATWNTRRIQPDPGKRTVSDVEKKALRSMTVDRRSMQTPDVDYAIVEKGDRKRR